MNVQKQKKNTQKKKKKKNECSQILPPRIINILMTFQNSPKPQKPHVSLLGPCPISRGGRYLADFY